ncbi:hypothetical protein HPP92_004785 [Vanilla planifolia]|uniref:cytokinin riboside 5'-monophosphate phosphoribohydrolase n=1 Tax=Vanilla planifolia TaxID=51239 RepID=A0A835RKH1_VANPL|nr:hypothetical protein HPP92_004785 [Vanilla planifolia]
MEKEKEARQPKFKRICVFCGSSQGKKKSYQDAAIELGKELVRRSIDLVYGGGSVGLMGLVSQAVYDGGRHVIGVIPKTLMLREITGETVGEVKAVADMHQRKAEMARQSDAFIALPGGYGTLEELLEVITWAQLGIHDKPVGLLNVDGYYNSLLSFIDKAVEEGFINPTARHIIVSSRTAKELMKKLEDYIPCHESVTSKMSWEIEQLELTAKCDISRKQHTPNNCKINDPQLCKIRQGNSLRPAILLFFNLPDPVFRSFRAVLAEQLERDPKEMAREWERRFWVSFAFNLTFCFSTFSSAGSREEEGGEAVLSLIPLIPVTGGRVRSSRSFSIIHFEFLNIGHRFVSKSFYRTPNRWDPLLLLLLLRGTLSRRRNWEA